ncbi:response regulator [Nocardioides sp. HB32]
MTSDGSDASRYFALIPDGLWVFDDQGVTTWANDRMAELLGRHPDEMVGLSVFDTLDEQGRKDFAGSLAEMVRTGQPRDNVDSYFVRPDGTAVWGLVSFRPVLDDQGRRTGWLHRVTPYTERKELLDALESREHQLAIAQRIAHIGSWSWDVEADRVTASEETFRIFGVEPGALDTFADYVALIHPDDRELTERSAAAGDGEEYSFDHRVMRPDGQVRWIRERGIVERDDDGERVRVSGTSQDITELRAADEQAAEATRRLVLVQQMAIAANRADTLREALAVAAAGVPEHTTWAGVCAYLYDAPGEPELLDIRGELPVQCDPVLAERARLSGEITIGTPSAMADSHSLVALPVSIGSEVICVIELIADEIPPDEDSYQLMRQIAGQLGVVAERERSAAQLAEARDDAMEASRLKSEFVATMSHEIRTPMNGVIGLTDLLMRTTLDEHQRKLTENLQGAGLTLLGIINDILDLSKIEAGKLELEEVDFDVRQVFDQAASVLGGPAHEKGLELVVACSPDVPRQVRGDAVRFGQIVTNLGSNAVKFTDRGEVLIQARVEAHSSTDVVLRVDVTDTGVGITPDQRGRLFEAFTQADPSTTRRHGGTGLGLAISRQLVEALGGEISVTSELGRGSTFSFTARLGAAAGTAAAPPAGDRELQGRRVLVVDDNSTNRLILTEQLDAWQMRSVAVASAAEALATLREAARSGQPFEVAVLDLVMPDTDGLELAARIRAEPSLAALRLLLLTSDQSVTRREVEDAGIRTSLNKPVRHTELRATLLTLLGGAASAPAPREKTTPGLGIRVLVVEDNRVNQLVATGILENLGCTVDLADDGVAAVELLTRPHEYAVVLMDCRMPRLDGFDATRRVRESEQAGRRVPIIAMTASVLEGERERCLAAGMDDYLTKPVDAAELERALRAWVRAPAPAADALPQVEPLPAPRTTTERGVLDPDRITMLDELRKDGVSFFERTAASFMGRVGSQLVAIREAVDRDSPTSLLTSAHQLKGSALNLGLPRVAAAAQKLESLGIAGTTEGSRQLLRDLTAEVEIAVAALQRATTGRP